MSSGSGRFGTDREGYRLLLAAGRQFGQRVWAVEGCQGVGRHLAQRLGADGETVVDVPIVTETISAVPGRSIRSSSPSSSSREPASKESTWSARAGC